MPVHTHSHASLSAQSGSPTKNRKEHSYSVRAMKVLASASRPVGVNGCDFAKKRTTLNPKGATPLEKGGSLTLSTIKLIF